MHTHLISTFCTLLEVNFQKSQQEWMEALLLEGSMLTWIENIVLSSMAFAPLCRVTSWTLQDVDWQDRAEMLMLITSYCTLPIQIFTRLWPMSSQPPLSLTLTASSEVRQGPWVIEAKSLPFSRASNLSEFHHWHHLKVYEWIQAQIWTDHHLASCDLLTFLSTHIWGLSYVAGPGCDSSSSAYAMISTSLRASWSFWPLTWGFPFSLRP